MFARSFRQLSRLVYLQRNKLCIPRTMASSSENNQQSRRQELKVVHQGESQQFFVELDPPDRGVLDYDILSDGSVNMHHTEVPSSYRGRGIAGQLAKAAFSHFTSEGTRMLLTCTYLQKYYRDHPEATTKDLVTLPPS